MKIGMISTDYLPNIGGLAAHVYYLSRALEDAGHDVVVVHPVVDSDNGIEKVNSTDIKTFRIHCSEYKGKLSHIVARSMAIVRGLNKVFEVDGVPDLLHQHDHRFSTFAMRWMSRQLPWIWTNHTSSFLHEYDSGYIRKLMVQVAYWGVDGIITAGTDRYKKSKSLWGEKIPVTYISNGVDVDKFSPNRKPTWNRFNIASGEFVVLCPSRLAQVKGVIYLVKAAKILVYRYPNVDWRFVFLGGEQTGNRYKDSYADHVKEKALTDSLREFVTFLGNLPMKDMPHINACADLIVMPSLVEAVSLSALEGMATQKPIVATNVGGLPQIVDHEETGLLVPPEDPQSLADAIHRAYSDESLRHEMAVAARELVVREYSWKAVAHKTVEFYNDCLT